MRAYNRVWRDFTQAGADDTKIKIMNLRRTREIKICFIHKPYVKDYYYYYCCCCYDIT